MSLRGPMTMTDADRLLRDYVKRFEAGGETDPSDLLEQLSGRERERLSALIDGYLENAAPPQAWDAEAFEGSLAERATARVAESWSSAAGELPHRLVELRNQHKLKRRELVARLANALGVASQEQKVAAYYHRLERGTLQSDRVSAKVFDALASILGTTTDLLRKAGDAVAPSAGGEPDLAFTRLTQPDPAAANEQTDYLAARTESDDEEQENWDEVDRLFMGG
jgi:transcriptional regulator with XRE-family HTH domain